MDSNFLGGLLQSASERGRAFMGYTKDVKASPEEALRQAEALVSGRGEATGVAIAKNILAAYQSFGADDRTKFVLGITGRFGADLARLAKTIEQHTAAPDAVSAGLIHKASEPRRQELIRRLNLAPGGTPALVKMREDVLARLKQWPELKALDDDFVHLFSSWFNRGFLVLRRIDWSTPANILEKIIRYEAVHAIEGWEDLRRRLEPADRRLYAFFHPALVDEPLIFVEVALAEQIPSAIAPLLAEKRAALPIAAVKTAVFYSISNAQAGLAGVSFGNFLIKQVVEDLKRELPQLETFVTLSPVPGFAKWLDEERKKAANLAILAEDARVMAMLDKPNWPDNAAGIDAVSNVLQALAAHYFLKAKDGHGRVVDPVARFHLGNGARLERINIAGDISAKGMQQSCGLMVNYLYDLKNIEINHEAFANRGEVAASSAIRKSLRGKNPSLVSLPSFAKRT